MKLATIQTISEFREVLSELNKITVDLLLFELQEYSHVMFCPYLEVDSNEYDNYYDFEKYGASFLDNQFSLERMGEKLVYKRQSNNEVYGFTFLIPSPFRSYNCKKDIGNLLGIIYMKE